MRSIKNFYHLILAILANIFFGFPSRAHKIICITGTDGKTTTATLIYHMLKTAGKKVALISTVGAYITGDEIDTGFHVTNPSAFALQKLLSRTRKEGIEYVVLETTSHGIDQQRNWGITPDFAGITNVTHEHLDYHKTLESYLRVKSRILTKSKFAFLNQDAKLSYELLKNIVSKANIPFTSVSQDGLSSGVTKAARFKFGETKYNFENVALACGIAKKIGIDESIMTRAIRSFEGIKGRMENIPNARGLSIIVDFAHTPNALEQALVSVRQKMKQEKKGGKLIVVFGCAGLRDTSKRPLMGKVATTLADLAVFTAEDPRTENVWTIINQMKSGVKTNHDRIVSVGDRRQALKLVLETLTSRGDTILVTGKGHEQSMNLDGVEYPWSDQNEIAKLLSVLT